MRSRAIRPNRNQRAQRVLCKPMSTNMQLTDTAPSRPTLRTLCSVCGSVRLSYSFSLQSHRVMHCEDCALMFLNPQPSDAELATIYSAEYFLGHDTEEGRRDASELKRATARQYLAELTRYNGAPSGDRKSVV